MGLWQSIRKNRQQSVTLGVSLLLVGFIAFLLVSNYRSQIKLRTSALDRLIHDIDKRAVSVSYFFSERNNDLKTMEACPLILTFFENKALGMSMEYGLRTSLMAISKRFRQFVNDKTIGGEPIYKHIVLLDHLGNLLADSRAFALGKAPEKNWQAFLTPESRTKNIILCGSKIFISVGYFFNNKYAGQILAEIVPQSVSAHLVKVDEYAMQYMGIVSGQDTYYAAEEMPPPLLNWGLGELGMLEDNQQRTFQLSLPSGLQTAMLAIRTPIPKTPLAIISVLPAAEVLGRNAPQQLLVILIALASAFIGGFVFVWRMNIQKLVLRTQLTETAKKEQIIAAKNLALIAENRQRQKAEADSVKAKEAAVSANLAKSNFLANMSHELRTPLNHIIGFTEIVADKHLGDLTERQEEYLNDVLDSSRHLLSLINDILDIAKIEAGKLTLQPSAVDVKNLFYSSMTVIREMADRHGVRLSLDVVEFPARILVDKRKFKQIVYNLLANAVKFTPDGGAVGVQVRLVDRAAVKDHLTTSKNFARLAAAETAYLQVEVTDTGIGLQQEDLERIFNSFDQVETSINRRFAGTGLGLSLTKSIVALHGGWIWVESEGLGHGCRFNFVIPLIFQSDDPDEKRT